MITLTQSKAPLATRSPSDSQKFVLNPNEIIQKPKPATHHNSSLPMFRRMGLYISTNAVSSAPMEGAARNAPKPTSPTCRISSSAVWPGDF